MHSDGRSQAVANRPLVGIGTISGATRCRKRHRKEVAIRHDSG